MHGVSCFRVKDALEAYLEKIGFEGEALPNLATLRQLHRRHVRAISTENLDVLLGRPISRNPRAAFRKIVVQGRGGSCFEMNGLFAFMLEAIGFRVTRMAGAVNRERMGDAAIGTHLALVVRLDRLWLADVGLGNGLTEPVPLSAGRIRQGFRSFSLERLSGGWWRFRNHQGAFPASFDFSPSVTDEAPPERASSRLLDDPNCPFAGQALVQRQFAESVETLVGPVHKVMTAAGTTATAIHSPDQFARLLRERFGIQVSDVVRLWEMVSSQHSDPATFAEAA